LLIFHELRSPRRPLVAPQYDGGVLERFFPEVLGLHTGAAGVADAMIMTIQSAQKLCVPRVGLLDAHINFRLLDKGQTCRKAVHALQMSHRDTLAHQRCKKHPHL
jgi:hypothetical protein